jgi:hypothetical protein
MLGTKLHIPPWRLAVARPQVARPSGDASDGEPNGFLSHCILVLPTAAPHLGETAEALLNFPQPAASGDYDLIHSPAVHEAPIFWMAHAPPHFQLLIASREEPPWLPASWRGPRMAALRLRRNTTT